jgi:hypothetical protein
MKPVIALFLVTVPAVASGAPPGDSPPGSLWLGGGIELLTAGGVSTDGFGGTVSTDLTNATGLVGNFDYQASDLFTIRVTAGYAFGMKVSGDTGDSASAIDVRLGGTVGKEVAPRVRLYGLAQLGYSSIRGNSNNGDVPDASGPTLTLGGGGAYDLSPKLRLYFELAYEFGYEDHDYGNGRSFEYHVHYLELGVGVQASIGH